MKGNNFSKKFNGQIQTMGKGGIKEISNTNAVQPISNFNSPNVNYGGQIYPMNQNQMYPNQIQMMPQQNQYNNQMNYNNNYQQFNNNNMMNMKQNSNNYENSKNNKNDIDIDDEKIITQDKNLDNNSEKIIDDEMEDLIYLKKTVSKEGKFISDDFIKYHKLTDTIIQDEDDIINMHMEVIKQDAKLLTEEGKLISLIKGIGTEEEKIEVDEYIKRLENVLDQKINLYSGLQDKIDIYKGHLKEEDQMRKVHPQFFVYPADL